MTTNGRTTALVDVEVYDASGEKVFQQFWDGQTFGAQQANTFSTTWRVPRNALRDSYTVKIGVFGTGWSGLRLWIDGAANFTVS